MMIMMTPVCPHMSQTYLEQNEGPGLQHMALKTDDIFATMRLMKAAGQCGGFEFMPRASDEYYAKLPEKIGDVLTEQQYKELQELGACRCRRRVPMLQLLERCSCTLLAHAHAHDTQEAQTH